MYSSKLSIDLMSFLSTSIMAQLPCATAPGKPKESLEPSTQKTLERARVLLDQMDQQLLEHQHRLITIRQTISIIKTKLLADARKRRDSETL
jgi:hypothetical protein